MIITFWRTLAFTWAFFQMKLSLQFLNFVLSSTFVAEKRNLMETNLSLRVQLSDRPAQGARGVIHCPLPFSPSFTSLVQKQILLTSFRWLTPMLFGKFVYIEPKSNRDTDRKAVHARMAYMSVNAKLLLKILLLFNQNNTSRLKQTNKEDFCTWFLRNCYQWITNQQHLLGHCSNWLVSCCPLTARRGSARTGTEASKNKRQRY